MRTKFQSEDFGSLESLELPNRALERNFETRDERYDTASIVVFERREERQQEQQNVKREKHTRTRDTFVDEREM